MAPEGGETYAEVQQRMRDWYDAVNGDTIAVAHGGTARALMVALGIETPASAATADRAGRGLRVRRWRPEEV
jgi:probable phosphoglycerate mutase